MYLMNRFVFFVVTALLVVGTTTANHAEAATMAEQLARMDVIIAEMQKLRAEFASLAQAPSTGGVVLGAATSAILTDDLSYGATNKSIEKIQKLLATDSEIYGDGTISGFFGPKTQDAIRRFQTRFGLDPVGVVGPSTKAVLEAFMKKYPNDTYPAGVLNGPVPQVAGASTSVGLTPTVPSVPTIPVTPITTNPFSTIKATGDGEEYDVTVVYADGRDNKTFVAQVRSEDDLTNVVAKKLGVTEKVVDAVLTVKTKASSGGSDDEEDADDALNDAEDAIDEAYDAIDEAEADGDDTSDAEDLLDEAEDLLNDAEDAYDDEDYDEAIDLAEEAKDLAEEAIDEL